MLDGLPERLAQDGRFPFGALNGPRPLREAASGDARQLIIGTYPSALHVGWRTPAYVELPPGARGRIASLAVDVEPTVFWDGSDADDRVARWKSEVGFIEGDHPGTHGHLTEATNGPSGAGLASEYFPALPFPLEDTAFTDVYPVYFVKSGTPARRGQADAIVQEYDSVVAHLSSPAGTHQPFSASTLPIRPASGLLPVLAKERFSHWLVGVVRELAPDHIVTLGEEVWQTMALAGLVGHATAPSLAHTRHHGGYGRPGTLHIANAAIEWTALAHPAAIRQSSDSPGSWREVHRTWFDASPWR